MKLNSSQAQQRPPLNPLLHPTKKRKLVHSKGGCGLGGSRSTCCSSGSSSLFAPKAKLITVRAPIMAGLTVSASAPASSGGLYRPFQRPMTKRRSYDKHAETALRTATLGQRRRMDGMAKLMARAGRGLMFKLPGSMKSKNGDGEGDSDEEEEGETWEEHKWEPLCVWHSPHDGGEAKGLPDIVTTETRTDEYGVEEQVQVKRPAPLTAYCKQSTYVPAIVCKWLRPHQREGVAFMYECTMSLRSFNGMGCILADDMGLGKTLQSISLLYTLLKTSITADNVPTAKRVIIVCPCSLVKNWDNEITKWIANGGPGPEPGVTPPRVMALAELDRATVEKNLDAFCRTNIYSVLIASYECFRTHVKRLTCYAESKCDLLICDEAHRLKNRDNQTTRALNSLSCRRRVLLTGTPMQNDLEEFYAMVDFCNPGVLGSPEDFRKKYLFPILRGREPDATDRQKQRMMECQTELSELVNQFILRRVNTLNAEHLPPKLVQVVCCNLTDVQRNMYEYLLSKMEQTHVLEGKQSNALGWIQLLMKLSNHPRLVADEDPMALDRGGSSRRGAAKEKTNYNDNEGAMTESLAGVSKFLPYDANEGYGSMMGRSRGCNSAPVRPELSGKMFVLWRLMTEMRKPNCRDKIVIVSNYTQTLDLIGQMCSTSGWAFCRLDGSIGMKKRQKMVDEFNDPNSSLIAFLLSSKAGGCGLNLIGGNRLVLFDPDWNPAVDKQAAARCWRDGQKKRCFTYRFLATGTVEEKIFQRQLSKEGLQSVVDDKEQVNIISSKDLRNLFKLRINSPSDTHDKLNCTRCKTIKENSEPEAMAVLSLQLGQCRILLGELCAHEAAAKFLSPLNPEEHEGNVSKEVYERLVKQPIDLGTIKYRMNAPISSKESYKSISQFAKDVNRIFNNVVKVWNTGQNIADAARRLQSWWVDKWSELVPKLMSIKPCAEKTCEQEKENNENDETRGEDFQEQIGMPDEEDMRSWSHHFSSDTCDDPVFRAAMKGYDHVSFVFGLEVTWSLIQQRRQEEEERTAMEELEGINEVDDDEVVSESDAVDDGKEKNENKVSIAEDDTSAKVDEKTTDDSSIDCNEAGAAGQESEDEEWTLAKVYKKDEMEKGLIKCSSSSSCHLNACCLWKSNLGEECSTCIDCQNEQFGGWPDGTEPAGELLECIRKHCSSVESTSVEEVSGVEEETSAVQNSDTPRKGAVDLDASKQIAAPTEKKGEWACTSCTFLNPESKKKCAVCFSKKTQK